MSSDAAILEAALVQFALTGVRRTSTDDIAQAAGVNRVTLYRRFGTREELVRAAYLHEAARVLGVIDEKVGPIPSLATDFEPAEYVVRMFSVTIRTLREHPVLRQMLTADREETLASMTIGAGDTLALAGAFVAERIRELRTHLTDAPATDADVLGVTFARIAQSLVLTPDGPPRLGSPSSLRRYAETVVVPMVLGTGLG